MDPILLKSLHLAAVFALFSSLGASMLAGSRAKFTAILHGISMILILLLGFALLKKPPMDQHWWMAKFGLWLFIGFAPVLSKRKILPPWLVFILTLAAASYAAYLGLRKPF